MTKVEEANSEEETP
jgi:hypothetical protein